MASTPSAFAPPASPPSPEPRVLYAGGPRWLKGADLALRAFARAAHHLPRAQLDMVGGFDWGAYEQMAEALAIRDRIVFHPYVAYESMPEVYTRGPDRARRVLGKPGRTHSTDWQTEIARHAWAA